MDKFLNQIKAQASQLDQSAAQPRLAVVSSVDPSTATVRVTIQPEDVLSGWLPLGTIWAGAGWGLCCLPSPGDQVLVLWQEGHSEHGIVVARLWSTAANPPAAPVGEFWLVHKTGTCLKLRNDGTIMSSAKQWLHTGDFIASGDIYDSHGSLSQLREHYNEHTHQSNGSPPTPHD